jgi:membrane-associated phospholipid phosphatase
LLNHGASVDLLIATPYQNLISAKSNGRSAFSLHAQSQAVLIKKMSAILLGLLLSQTPNVKHLNWNPKIDIPVTGVLVSGWVLSEFAFKFAIAPKACRWCETNGFDTGIRSAFNPSLTPSSNGIASFDMASNITGFVALPLGLLGLDALLSWRDRTFQDTFLVDLTLMLEATFTALAINQFTKFLVGRARPYTVGASDILLAEHQSSNDHFLSFFSGHSTFSFGLAVSAATIMSMRNYRHAWLAWLVGIPLAATTAILRLAADKHWGSDVLLGTAMGALFGAGMPLLFHAAKDWPVTVAPISNGISVAGRF